MRNAAFQLQLPVHAQLVIERLNQAGYEAYAVGGCVRDALLGKQPDDWDITTSALPEQTKTVFQSLPVIETGLQHGTITILIDHIPVEVTTYRQETTYTDHRHPDQVLFTEGLQEDLCRRDFTINAMAYHPQHGLIDFFDGLQDLQAETIRAVGNPAQRFEEDALRIMRALRFASVLGFHIAQETANSLLAAKETLCYIAPERLQVELSKLLCGEHVYSILYNYGAVLGVIIPELLPMAGFQQHNKHHIYDVYEHTIHTVAATPADLVLRLTMLLHDIGKPNAFELVLGEGHFYGHANLSETMTADILQRLRFSNQITEQILPLILYHDVQIEATEYAVKRWLNRKGERFLRQLLQVKRADNKGQNPAYAYRQTEIDELEAILDKVIEEGKCFSLKDLAVDGKDLLAIGFPQGKIIGVTLNALLEAVLQDDIPNQKEALLKRAQFIHKQSTYFKD